MNDKDRELLQQALHQVGDVGSQAFGYLVRFQIADGITGLLFSLLVFVSTFYYMKWGAKRFNDDRYSDEEMILLGGVIMAAVTIISVFIFLTALTQIIAPEGAAITSILRKIS